MSNIWRDLGGASGGRGARIAAALALALLVAGTALLASGGVEGLRRKGGGGGPPGPRMEFMHGRLSEDGTGVFRIGKVSLVFTSHSTIVVEGKSASTDQLSDGLEASVMGRPAGARFIVEQCTAAEPPPPQPRHEGDAMQWSTEDPTVGWGRSPS